jgi:hypothetical protein
MGFLQLHRAAGTKDYGKFLQQSKSDAQYFGLSEFQCNGSGEESGNP